MGTGARVLWEWGRKNHREGAMGLDGEMGEPRRNRGGGGVGFWVLPRESGLLEEGAMGFWVLRKDGVGCSGVGEKSQIRIGEMVLLGNFTACRVPAIIVLGCFIISLHLL
ncbi:unnamed protein product [Prunus armeniaca]|uniref:Uncharacterized protein n=1 Tax=Prunus armeniaca TaxID=36596 RepID=A0A6J5X721_PRUAR|nr:unnamed protein product [Prunus armeniaca]